MIDSKLIVELENVVGKKFVSDQPDPNNIMNPGQNIGDD